MKQKVEVIKGLSHSIDLNFGETSVCITPDEAKNLIAQLRAVVPVPSDVQEAADNYEKSLDYYHYTNDEPGIAYAAGMLAERERMASCPTIKGWVARDMKKQALYFYTIRPTRSDHVWTCPVNSCCPIKDKKAFPDLKWEDEPKKVSVTIKAE